MENKEWCGPELIVLVRSKPEEAVLTFCKGERESSTSGAQTTAGGCWSLSSCFDQCASINAS